MVAAGVSTSVLASKQDTVLEPGAGMGPLGGARVRSTLEDDQDATVIAVERNSLRNVVLTRAGREPDRGNDA